MDRKSPLKDTTLPTPVNLTPPEGGWKPIRIPVVRMLMACDKGTWVGQVLDHCFVVQASSPEELLDNVTHVILSQCIFDQAAGVEMLKSIPPAEEEFFEAFHASMQLQTTHRNIDMRETGIAQIDLCVSLISQMPAAIAA